MYQSGTLCSRMASSQPAWKPPFFTLPFRTASMMSKAILGSTPCSIR